MSTSSPQPQSTASSVAFDIPIKKKEGSSPTVQKRLVAQANSPRREFSLADVNKKLDEASKRKDAINAVKVKTASHNADAKKVFEESVKSDEARNEELERHIRSKLGNAEAKRDGLKNTWVKRLSTAAKSKVQRAAKVKEDEKWQAKELEAKIDIKGLAADLRREETKLKVQDGLTASNHDKIRRGQLALSLAEIEAKHAEIHSEQKIEAANHRREMQHLLAQTRIGQSTTEKREKAADARRQEEEGAAKRREDIDTKIKLAEERKNQVMAGRIQNSTQTNDKLQRAADVRRQEDERAKEQSGHINAKVELANQRRENIIREQTTSRKDSHCRKEQVVTDRQRREEDASTQQLKNTYSKLQSASARKEDILASKVKAAKDNQQAKQERAKKTWLSSLDESKELQQSSEKRQKDAAERKNKITKEMLEEMHDTNKSKIDRIAKMNKNQELQELQNLVEIEKKLAVASASRKKNLVTKSSTKKRMLSPRLLPADKNEIEARINQANLRREIYLTDKVEKAKHNKNTPKIKKALFASVSPVSPKRRADESPKERQRIKASRLEEFDSLGPEENDNKHYGFNVPLLTISGIAVVIVGLLSFLKSK